MSVSDIGQQIREIYTAPTKQAEEQALEDFAQKWKNKYSYAALSPGVKTGMS